MRVALHIDSANDAEMRRALMAWHFTTPIFKTPILALDGLTVKVVGSSWNLESPPIEPERAALILRAAESGRALELLRRLRDDRAGVHTADDGDSPVQCETLREV